MSVSILQYYFLSLHIYFNSFLHLPSVYFPSSILSSHLHLPVSLSTGEPSSACNPWTGPPGLRLAAQGPFPISPFMQISSYHPALHSAFRESGVTLGAGEPQ